MSRINLIKWVATTFTLSGAVSVSMGWEPYNMILLNTGAGLFLVWGCMIHDKAIIAVNSGLILIYVYGLVTRFAM